MWYVVSGVYMKRTYINTRAVVVPRDPDESENDSNVLPSATTGREEEEEEERRKFYFPRRRMPDLCRRRAKRLSPVISVQLIYRMKYILYSIRAICFTCTSRRNRDGNYDDDGVKKNK